MKILALDLAKQTGWATNSGDIISFGSVRFLSSEFDDLAKEFVGWLKSIISKDKPDVVVYEAPVVKHPHAAKVLIGLSWLTIWVAAEQSIPSYPVGNTAVKKYFVGRVYGKTTKPYPGIVEAHRRGFDAKTTDEADAIAIIHYVRDHPDAFQSRGRTTSDRKNTRRKR